jgi:CheY-like chemotaxis protein
MGGELRVTSEPGMGSTFSFVLSFEQPAADVQELEGFERAVDETPKSSELGQVCKLLLAEDAEANRMVIEAYLRSLPVELDWAPNGAQAVEMACRTKYDLILMDIQMPEMDGYEATRRIRQYESEQSVASTPILALTAHAFSEEAAHSVEAGCDALLTKPIRRKILLEAIYRHTRLNELDKRAEALQATP